MVRILSPATSLAHLEHWGPSYFALAQHQLCRVCSHSRCLGSLLARESRVRLGCMQTRVRTYRDTGSRGIRLQCGWKLDCQRGMSCSTSVSNPNQMPLFHSVSALHTKFCVSAPSEILCQRSWRNLVSALLAKFWGRSDVLDRMPPLVPCPSSKVVKLACGTRRCDGVEPDNVDAYANSVGISLTYNDQLTFNRWLANEGHKRNLAVALKNDGDQVGSRCS